MAPAAGQNRLAALAVLVCVLGAHCGNEGAGEVHPLESGELGEARSPVVDLWTHTEGAPRGMEVSIRLPDGEREAVDRIVTQKKIDIAAAALHHATVMAKTQAERKKLADEADESAITKAKIAETALARMHRVIKSTKEALSEARTKKMNADVANTEAKAVIETVSKKKKKAAKAKATIAGIKQKKAGMVLTKLEQKLSAAKYKLVGAKSAAESMSNAAGKARLAAVAQQVRWRAAEHAKLHAQFMKLKSKNLRKLALARYSREMWHKKTKQGRQDVRSNQDMVNAMGTSPGAKASKAALKRAVKRTATAKKKWLASRKNVNKVKTAINKAETKWARKMAYKATIKTANQGAAAWKTEKAFTAALSNADRVAKKQVADQAHKELLADTKNSERATANFEHVKFAARASKKEAKRRAANEKKRKAKRKKEAAKRKKEAAAAKRL